MSNLLKQEMNDLFLFQMIDSDQRNKVTIDLESDLESHPRCIHGPTLLFTRSNVR